MFEELLEIAKNGEPLTAEQITVYNQLSKKEKDKISKTIIENRDKALNKKINQEFKRVYSKLLVEDPKTAEFLASIAKIDEVSGEDLTKKVKDNKNYSLNEVLIAVYRDSDTPGDIKERCKEMCYQKNAGLVFYVVKKFAAKNDGKMTMDDLGQECKLLFFSKAFNTYDLSKGFRFSTYVTTVMRNAMSSLHKNLINKQRALETSMENPVADDGGSIKILLDYQIDLRPNPEELCRKEMQNEILYDCLNELTLEQKFIAYCRYGLGDVPVKTQAEIADYMHMSQANVSKIEGIMRTKLHQLLNAREMF